MAVGICHADHVAPSIHKKLALTSLTSGGSSVGIVRLWTEAMELQVHFNFLTSAIPSLNLLYTVTVAKMTPMSQILHILTLWS
jgi:hypothetical protein